MKRIIQITPTVPPTFSGVGDYALNLSRYWPDRSVSWDILTARLPKGASEAWPEANVSHFDWGKEGLTSRLVEASGECVILHYVGYGYDRLGIPEWLPSALADWKSSAPDRKVAVMFHELWATGKPWSRAFWVKPRAQRLVRRLVDTSDFWVTNCIRWKEEIARLNPDEKLNKLMPVPTNIAPPLGKVAELRPWPLDGNGQLNVVVFGSGRTRLRALKRHQHALHEMERSDVIRCLTLIGSKPDFETSVACDRIIQEVGLTSRVESMYDCASSDISAALERQDLGLIENDAAILTKSGSYAACATHGILCLVKDEGTSAVPTPYLPVGQRKGVIIRDLYDLHRIAELRVEAMRFANNNLLWPASAAGWLQCFNEVILNQFTPGVESR